MSIGYLADSFDVISLRDLDLIAQARARCSRLLVGVFTDDYVKQLLGRHPLVPFDERAAVVQHVDGVSDVVSHDPLIRSAPQAEASVLFAAVGSPVSPGDDPTWLSPRAEHIELKRRDPAIVGRFRSNQGGHQGQSRPVVGYVPGAWDAFHIGHLNILRRAREQCDYLVVGVVTDEALHQAKGKYPIIPLAERMQVVAHLGMVDDVVVDRSSDKLEVWREVGFDVLFKGDDWLGTPKGDKLQADMASVGVTVKFFPYTVGTSSTLRRAQLNAL
jgi:glycerol-3-phosphate cytidylyltransferase